jgi:AcrR family transcriptional regulator
MSKLPAEKNALPWIETGYGLFAKHGPEALRIEQLAREVGISKSSFYHHFADVPTFVDRLLHYHLDRGAEIARRTAACSTFDPDFIELLVDVRMDLCFNWQLRNHREDLAYQLCFQRAHSQVEDQVLGIWSEALGIPGQTQLARNIFVVVTDLFYQRFPKTELTAEWFRAFLAEVDRFMRDVVLKNEMGRSEKSPL